jgi:hypothetical protein
MTEPKTQTTLPRREIFMANGSYQFCDVVEFDAEANRGKCRAKDGREFEIKPMYGTWGEVRP